VVSGIIAGAILRFLTKEIRVWIPDQVGNDSMKEL